MKQTKPGFYTDKDNSIQVNLTHPDVRGIKTLEEVQAFGWFDHLAASKKEAGEKKVLDMITKNADGEAEKTDTATETSKVSNVGSAAVPAEKTKAVTMTSANVAPKQS